MSDFQQDRVRWQVQHASQRLQSAGLDTPALDARILLQDVLGYDHAQFISNDTKTITTREIAEFNQKIERRLVGEPVFRILGYRNFYGLDFKLNDATLEPRPDTECLVDEVLQYVEKKHGLDAPLNFVDIGTGTGAIAIALLHTLKNAKAVLIDLSQEALDCALENAKIHGVSDRVELRLGSYLDPLKSAERDSFDFITSNPPYINTSVIEELSVEVQKFDPMLALDGGVDGLAAYREILPNCSQFLKSGGGLFLEYGHDQGQVLLDMARDTGWVDLAIIKDLCGNDRLLVGFKV